MAKLDFQAQADGKLMLVGQLAFSNAKQAYQAGLQYLSQYQQLDLAGIDYSDSSGLAVLIAWLAAAKKRDLPLHLLNLPAQLLAMAKLSEVEHILLAQPAIEAIEV